MELRDLTPEAVRGSKQAFVAIAADVDGEYWTEDHFLADLPEKWRLSFALWEDERPVGYAIISRKTPDCVHLHHFMLSPGHRGQGLGAGMAKEMEARARRAGARLLTLKVAAENERAARFYDRQGYSATGRDGAYLVFEKQL